MSGSGRSSRDQVARERFGLEELPHRLKAYRDQPIGEELPELFRHLGLGEAFWTHALEKEWPQLVGAQVARHTRPGRFQRGTLHVFVSNSTWLAELSRMGQKQMLDNIQKRFGADRVKGIRLQIDPEPPARKP